jgi:hypothetical protein
MQRVAWPKPQSKGAINMVLEWLNVIFCLSICIAIYFQVCQQMVYTRYGTIRYCKRFSLNPVC